MLIYLLTNTINGKKYVGQTTRSLAGRLAGHRWESTRKRRYRISQAIAKYGWGNFTVEVLKQCATPEELDAEEIRLIKELGTLVPLGYNFAEGGNTAGKHSEATKKKLSEMRKGKGMPEVCLKAARLALSTRVLSEETHKKLSESQKGNSKGLGHVKTPEVRRTIGLKQSGEKNHAATLTWAIVTAIREDYKGGMRVKDLAAKYSISHINVGRIIHFRTWVPEGMVANTDLVKHRKEGAVKLTWELVKLIRLDYSNGVKIAELHRKYKVPTATLGRVVHFKLWLPIDNSASV